VVAIVGYTNAGKSTLLNSLTGSRIRVEDRLFATLDPASRRLRFPKEREILLTDTVGFIRDLPGDLLNAFRATLEELSEANLLVHLVDVNSPHFEEHIAAVGRILRDLGIDTIPQLLVFNKVDLAGSKGSTLASSFGAIPIVATDSSTLTGLSSRIEERLWKSSENNPDPLLDQSVKSDSNSTAAV
jgi:GTP-binding protein HflX